MKILSTLLFTFLMCFATMTMAADAVDINNADAASLMKILKGVGPGKASAIVTYRKQHGPFTNVDQLAQVKGIGKRTVEINRDVITVGKAETSSQ